MINRSVEYTPENQPVFSISHIPVSDTARCLAWGCTQDWLHPANEGQAFFSRTIGSILIRPILRTIYALAVTILISPLSLFLHIGVSAIEEIRSNKAYAWEHLKAAGVEFLWIASVIMTLGISCFTSYGIGGNRFDQRYHGYIVDAATPFGALYITQMMFPSALVHGIADNGQRFILPYDQIVRNLLYSTRC